MKRFSWFICLVCLFFFSCKEKAPEGYVEYQGSNYKEPKPVQYDSNGNGVIDPSDKYIEVLGTSISVSQTPDGKPLYNSGETPSEPGDTTGSGSLVPSGQRLCYHDLQRNCDKYGGLYSLETSMNTSFEEMKDVTASQQIDTDADGVLDYINEIRDTQISLLVDRYYAAAALAAENDIEAAAHRQIGIFLLENQIKDAITAALLETLYEHNDFIDISNIEQKVNVAVAQSIIDAVELAGIESYIAVDVLEDIAFTISEEVAANIANDIASAVSTAFLEDFNASIASGSVVYVQGLCPDGYHIPSDVEWMIFEKALGMSIQDLTKYGETVTNRGESADVVQKMLDDHSFEFGGYASINGTFAQLEEAGVYWSSSVGTDEYGDYVWVRQIDASYTGVLRYKHYEKSGLSIRCFKNN